MTSKRIYRLSFLSLIFVLIHGCSTLTIQRTITNPVHQYFLEIALGSEYGNDKPRIKKWNKNIRVQVKGDPTKADLQTLKQVISELNALVSPNITLSNEKANLEIHFIPESMFSEIEKHYKSGNLGYFWTWWNPTTYEINFARILISDRNITQQERNHLIREELTQSLGLMNDSPHYPDSIFYQPWSRVTTYSKMDRVIIKLLYQENIQPGMGEQDIINILTSVDEF